MGDEVNTAISWDVAEGESINMSDAQADFIYKWVLTASDRVYDTKREVQPWYKLNGIRDFSQCTDLTPVESFFSNIMSSPTDPSCIAHSLGAKVAIAINSIALRPSTKECIDMYLKWRMYKNCHGRNASANAIVVDMLSDIARDMVSFFSDYWNNIRERMNSMGRRFYKFNLGIEHYIHEVSVQSKMECVCLNNCPCCLDDAPRSDLDGVSVAPQFNFLIRLHEANCNQLSDGEEEKEDAFVLEHEAPGQPRTTARRVLQMDPVIPVSVGRPVGKAAREMSSGWGLKATPTKRFKTDSIISVSPIVRNYVNGELGRINRDVEDKHEMLENRLDDMVDTTVPDLQNKVENLEQLTREHVSILENLDQSDIQQEVKKLKKMMKAQEIELRECRKDNEALEDRVSQLETEGLTLVELRTQLQNLRSTVSLLTAILAKAAK